jgi:hypothetical protein
VVFLAEVMRIAPSLVPPPTASVNVMSPVPATNVSALAVPASESIAPRVMLPFVVVSVTSAVRIVFPFKVKLPPGMFTFAPILIWPLPDALRTRLPAAVVFEMALLITILPPDAALMVRLLLEVHVTAVPIVMVPVCPALSGLPIVVTVTFPPPNPPAPTRTDACRLEAPVAIGWKGLAAVTLELAEVVIVRSVGSSNRRPFSPFGAKVFTDPK